MDYLLWRKNSIIEPEQDRDLYPWKIWYIWKAKNKKLFRGIDRDPLELVRHAESECQVWFDANEVVQTVAQDNINEEPQVFWEYSTYGDKKLSLTRISLTFGSRNNAVGDGEYAATFNLPEL
uniref:Uncharacterized protein n=1 Tax=Brassica oleracea var. oleracea TaxID=109376 RepID=A0A0D3ATP8_BRAOL